MGTVARVHQRVTLADGRHLPRGLIGRVHDLRIDTADPDPIVVCQIEDPLASGTGSPVASSYPPDALVD